MHLTLRARREVGSLRAPRAFAALLAALEAAQRDSFRVVQFSVQEDHLHLIAEACDGATLTSGVRGLVVRVARAVNRALGRRGAVWGDRYYRRDLTTPREVHHALAYVLCNERKHHAGVARFDRCSSAPWFDGWRAGAGAGGGAGTGVWQATSWDRERQPEVAAGAVAAGARPVRAARTWLLTTGWRRYGLLDPWATPGARESWRRVAARQSWELASVG